MTTNWWLALRLSFFLIVATLVSGAGFPNENERLIAASRLWVTVAFFHPYIADKKADWDSAFLAALPKIRSASTPAEYSNALSALLDSLNDPCTYVLSMPRPPAMRTGVITTNPPGVIDLRRVSDPLGELEDLIALYTDKPFDAPRQRSLLRTAFDTSYITRLGRHFNAGKGMNSGSVFILGENALLPEIGAAMAAANQATVVSESPHFQIAGVETITLDLLGAKAIVRLSEPEMEIPYQLLSAGDIDSKALSFLGKPPQTELKPQAQITPATFDEAYPSIEARILAAAKTWGTIRYFFAYKDLMDEDWDDIFATYLPKFIAAKDAREYNLTLTGMLMHLTDSHTFATSKTLEDYFGEVSVGLRLRMLDKHPVIISVLDPAAVTAGIKPGDIIKRVDGESIVDRFNTQVEYVPAGTPQRSSFDTLRRILNGRAGSKVTLGIESPTGEAKSVTLERSNASQQAPQRTTEPARMLEGNIGYVDLDRVSTKDAGAAMQQFQASKAIILDLRGRAPAAKIIAAYLAQQPNTPSAIVTTPFAMHPDVLTTGIATQTASTFLVQTLVPMTVPTFKGKTVALIDERTIGESEHAGFLFEAANKTEFIGVPSAGADSELATFAIPGGITITYSARDIRHANGGKLQRLGLQTNGAAPDTANSIRLGKDEALETARKYLSQ